MTAPVEGSLNRLGTWKPDDDPVFEVEITLACPVAAARELDTGQASDAGIVFVVGHVSALAHPANHFDGCVTWTEPSFARLTEAAAWKNDGILVVKVFPTHPDPPVTLNSRRRQVLADPSEPGRIQPVPHFRPPSSSP